MSDTNLQTQAAPDVVISPDCEALRSTLEAKTALIRITQAGNEINLNGTRESVWGCMALFSKAIQIFTKKNNALPDFLISSEQIPFVPSRAVKSARLFANRDDMLELWPQGGVVCEVGTHYGDFAKKIWSRTSPSLFHIIDISMASLDKDFALPLVEAGKILLHEGKSHAMIPQIADNSLDAAYIDGDHWYDTVAGDIAAIVPKVKAGGLIVFNDYTSWSALEGTPYGVLFAVNQLLQNENFEIAGFALSPGGVSSHDGAVSPPGGNHDIAVRKLR